MLRKEDGYRLLVIFSLAYLSVGSILGRMGDSVKNGDIESREGYIIARPEAREHPRLNSQVTKKPTPREPYCGIS